MDSRCAQDCAAARRADPQDHIAFEECRTHAGRTMIVGVARASVVGLCMPVTTEGWDALEKDVMGACYFVRTAAARIRAAAECTTSKRGENLR